MAHSEKQEDIMKNLIQENRILWGVMVLIAIVMLAMMGQGCATSGVGKAYDGIYTATVVYDTTMQLAADQYAQGNITENQKAKIIKQAKIAYNSILAAQKALKIYKLAEMRADNEEMSRAQKTLLTAIDVMNEAQDVLVSMISE
jgi:hypothetical protein